MTATTTATISDVKTYILSSATTEEIGQIIGAIRVRESTLKAIVAAAVTVDADGTLTGLTPKYLNGLTGTVQSIRGQRCDFLLDSESTRRLRYLGARKYSIPAGTELYVLVGVPLSCVTVA